MLVSNNSKIYVGQTEVSKVYQGTNVIYEKSVEPTYTEVLYLESDGYQYINTLFPATIDTKIDIDFQYTSNTINSKTRIFGSRKDWNLNGFYAGTASNNMNGAYWFLVGDIVNDRWHNASANSNTDRHNLVLSKAGAYLDGTNIWVPDDVVNSFTPFSTIALFGALEGNGTNHASIYYGIVRIYKCKIYDNDILVRDFIPVLDENNVPCMYDKLNKKFYYNAGTGTFTYKTINKLSYIKSTGTQWINTEFTATDNTKVEIQLSNVTGDDSPVVSASTDWNMGRYIMTSQDNRFIFWYVGKHEFGATQPVNDVHTITIYRDVITYDGTTPFNDSTNRNVPNLTNLWIFATPGGQRNPNKFKLYYCKIWDNGVLVRDLIPAMDDNYNACLYDKVEKKYYYNAGTGTFNYGTV